MMPFAALKSAGVGFAGSWKIFGLFLILASRNSPTSGGSALRRASESGGVLTGSRHDRQMANPLLPTGTSTGFGVVPAGGLPPRTRTNTPLRKAKTILANDTAIQAIRMRAPAVSIAMMESLAWLTSSFCSSSVCGMFSRSVMALTVEICSAATNDAEQDQPHRLRGGIGRRSCPGAGEDAGNAAAGGTRSRDDAAEDRPARPGGDCPHHRPTEDHRQPDVDRQAAEHGVDRSPDDQREIKDVADEPRQIVEEVGAQLSVRRPSMRWARAESSLVRLPQSSPSPFAISRGWRSINDHLFDLAPEVCPQRSQFFADSLPDSGKGLHESQSRARFATR